MKCGAHDVCFLLLCHSQDFQCHQTRSPDRCLEFQRHGHMILGLIAVRCDCLQKRGVYLPHIALPVPWCLGRARRSRDGLAPRPHRARGSAAQRKMENFPLFALCCSVLLLLHMCEHPPWQQLFPFVALHHADVTLRLTRCVWMRGNGVTSASPRGSAQQGGSAQQAGPAFLCHMTVSRDDRERSGFTLTKRTWLRGGREAARVAYVSSSLLSSL